MKNEEALNIIDVAIAEVEWEYPMEYAAAFEVAKEALKKQISKKPTVLPYNGTSETIEEIICTCGYYFGDAVKGDARLFHKPNFCEKCGQALDWRADNETLDDQF